MSVDLSDAGITSAITSVSDPVSPISWYASFLTFLVLIDFGKQTPLTGRFAVKYHPTADKTLILLSTGFDPWLPRWQETIEAHKAEPIFGYGVVAKGRPMREGGEKGVVLVYLPEEVTGVRRARAVVHSRALANKFPDYSAIITISHPSQISEDFVRDQVNFYNQPVSSPMPSPAKPRTLAQMEAVGFGHPSAKGDAPSPTVRAIQPSTSSARSMDRPLPAPPVAPIDLPDHQSVHTQTPPRVSTPPPPAQRQADTAQHGRKDSLSSRFAKVLPTFTKSTKTDNEGTMPESPKSPNSSRFNTLTSGFGAGRREGSQGQQTGRNSMDREDSGQRGVGASAIGNDERNHGRDVESPTAARDLRASAEEPGSEPRARAVHFDQGRHPNSGGQGASEALPPGSSSRVGATARLGEQHMTSSSDQHAREPSSPDSGPPPPLPAKSPSHSPTAPTFNRLHTLGAAIINWPSARDNVGTVFPSDSPKNRTPFPMSPTASAALSTARAKQLDKETRMHDQFRRDEEDRARQRVGSASPVDRPEEEQTRIRVNSGNRAAGIVRTPTPMRQQDYEDEDEGLPYDRPEEEAAGPAGQTGSQPLAEAHTGPPPDYAERSAPSHPAAVESSQSNGYGVPYSLSAFGLGAAISSGDHSTHHGDIDAVRAGEGGAAEVEARRTETEAESRRVEEAEMEERRLRLEAEEMEKRRRRDEARLQEEERQRIAEEEAERTARQEEEARLRQEEEEARQAKILQEQQEMEAARQAEEAEAKERATRQAEAEALANAKEAERVRARKVSEAKEELGRAKAAGEVMLKGHVTVQTTKSVIWRRRHFHLMPTELRLFKTDTDTSPIQVISLAPGTRVSQTYEESQVQGSFKILSAGTGEDFFLFSDAPEDKEVLLEGMSIALGSENVHK